MREWLKRLFGASKYKRKLTLYLTPEVYDRLHSTRSLIEAQDIIEVVRRSLAVYDYEVRESANGGKIILRNADGTEQEIDLNMG